MVLLVVALLAYGLLIPQLGFYWDDLPMSWIRYELGTEAMRRYFSTNRPVWGLLYQVTTRLLPHAPLPWQVFALFWRWVTGVLVWAVTRALWPHRERVALATGVLFLLYPGFNQQWAAYLYSHFFIVLAFFLLSYLCMLQSLRSRRFFWPLTAGGVLFSALNLWMMEYFFTLELMRPFVLFLALRKDDAARGRKVRKTLRRAFAHWLPYLFVFAGDVLWRLFVFNNQVYQTSLLADLRADFIGTLRYLLSTVPSTLWTVSAAAWGQVFQGPRPGVDGPRTIALYAAVMAASAGAVGASLWARKARVGERGGRRAGWEVVALGAVACLLAGWPFWLIEFPPALAFPASRFTLPFALGVALILAGLLELLPRRWLWASALVVLAGLAAGRQFLWSNDFRRDWNVQKNLFWQMTWRAPALAPDTVVLLNEGALRFYSDNSLSASLNWIYAPDLDDTGHIPYVLFYPTERLGGSLRGLEPGLPVRYDFLAGTFSGTTSQVVAFYYQPPGCLRLLDPDLDAENRLIPDATLMRDAARLSSSEWILPEERALMPEIYAPEPAHAWCYFFEKADLARQTGDWSRVVELGEEAFALGDYPNDPVERFVFIEGYAHEGRWERARRLSMESYRIAPSYVGPLLCRLWERIEAGTADRAARRKALDELYSALNCYP